MNLRYGIKYSIKFKTPSTSKIFCTNIIGIKVPQPSELKWVNRPYPFQL